MKHFQYMVLAAALGFAPSLKAEDNPVVFEIDGTAVKKQEFMEKVPPRAQAHALDNARLINQVVEQYLVEREAKKGSFDKDADVQKKLDQYRMNLVREAYLKKASEADMTDAKIKEEFEKMNAKPKQEVSARHILVRDEDEAKKLIAKAMKGESFEDLAKECSECPSKAQGGSLGFFTRESMVRPFSNVAFAIARTVTKARAEADKKGMKDKSVDALIKAKLLKMEDIISRKPVKTQFGWHLIKVDDVREQEKPKFDDQMRDKIKRKLAQKFVRKHVLSLRDKAQIKMHFPKAAEAEKSAG